MIPHSRPTLVEEDAQAVARIVRGGGLAQGPEVAGFERALAERLGTEDAAAVASGSMALELALRGLGIDTGDEVLIPSYVCDALHHAVTRCGGVPVLVDADPATLSLSPLDAKRRITRRTRAVIVPHAFGLAADVDAFAPLGVPIVEDCAQALGAVSAGRPVGSRGQAAVCSFYATKLLTTGEGGLVGGPRALVAGVRAGRDYDEHVDLAPRFNAKLTDLQAALGRSQLVRFDAFLTRRRAIAARYRVRLAGLPCRLPADTGGRHVYHRFVIEIERPVDQVIAELERRDIAARRPVFRPIHRALGLGGYPEAERLWARALSLPCYPSLSDADVDTVAAALTAALEE